MMEKINLKAMFIIHIRGEIISNLFSNLNALNIYELHELSKLF